METDLSNFINITGCCDEDEANKWLQMTDNDLDASIELYFSANDDSSNDNNMEESKKRGSEDDIRSPDETKREKLIDREENIFEFDSNPTDSIDINPIPKELLFDGNFEKARKFATSQNKLLIINIQIRCNLESININKDIWGDTFITDIVKDKYIFLQLYSDNVESMISNYNIFNLPVILIINPITGMLLWKNNTSIDKNDFTSKIIELISEDKDCKANETTVEEIEPIHDLNQMTVFSVEKLLKNFPEEIITFRNDSTMDSIDINISIKGKRINFISDKNFELLYFCKQIAKEVKDNFPESDEFKVYYDYPQKNLLDQLKKENCIIKNLDFDKVRFFVTLLDSST